MPDEQTPPERPPPEQTPPEQTPPERPPPERLVWVDGVLTPWLGVTVHLLSQSLQRGTLVFDVLPVEHGPGGPFGLGLREHVERFVASAALTGVPLPHDPDVLTKVVGEVARANPGCDTVRLNAWWGDPTFDLLPVGAVTVAVAAYAGSDLHTLASPRPPARLALPGVRKIPGDVVPVQAKVAAAYAHASVAKARARAAGYTDVLLLDEHGGLAELGTMSFALVVDGGVLTAGLERTLDGITRRIVVDLATDEGLAVTVGELPPSLLDVAAEAFIMSTTAGVVPVAQIGEHRYEPGPITGRLTERFEAVRQGGDPLAERWRQPL